MFWVFWVFLPVIAENDTLIVCTTLVGLRTRTLYIRCIACVHIHRRSHLWKKLQAMSTKVFSLTSCLRSLKWFVSITISARLMNNRRKMLMDNGQELWEKSPLGYYKCNEHWTIVNYYYYYVYKSCRSVISLDHWSFHLWVKELSIIRIHSSPVA